MNDIKRLLVEIIMGAIIVVLIIFLLRKGEEVERGERNMEALTDSLHILKTHEGELLYYKQSFLLKMDEWEKYTSIKEKEIKEMEKQLKDKVEIIEKMKGVVRTDTLWMKDSVWVKEDTIYSNYKWEDRWMRVGGRVKVWNKDVETRIDSIRMDVPLMMGYTEKGTLWVKTENPYVGFSSIEGGKVDRGNKNKKKHWNIGIGVGVGVMYDLIEKRLGAGPYIGVGLSGGWDF